MSTSPKAQSPTNRGAFELKDLPPGKIQLIVSYVGFENYTKDFTVYKDGKYTPEIELVPTSLDLQAVEVTAMKEKKRLKYIKQFSQNFLGKTANSAFCQIKNPEVLEVKMNADGGFSVTASSFIEIENLATGYQTYVLLEHFHKNGEEVSYSGKPFFRELEPRNDSQAKLWERNRRQTYLGSTRHFLQCLYENRTWLPPDMRSTWPD